jgi:hypothetical protein
VRPRQRKSTGDDGQVVALHRLSRRRPDFVGRPGWKRCSRRRLENLSVREVEGAHLEEVCAPKATTEAALKIARQPNNELLPVIGPSCSLLFLLDNPPADRPVRRSDDGVDGSDGAAARGIDEMHDVPEHRVITRRARQTIESGPFPLHAWESAPRLSRTTSVIELVTFGIGVRSPPRLSSPARVAFWLP